MLGELRQMLSLSMGLVICIQQFMVMRRACLH